MIPSCPSSDQWRHFHGGDLSETDQDALADHLDTCPDCLQLLERLRDSEPSWLTSAHLPSSLAEVPPAFLEQLRNGPPPEDLLRRELEDCGIVVRRSLGQGSFGVVFEASTSLHPRIAVKVLLPGRAVDARERERFLGEARAAAAVASDYVVRVISSGLTPSLQLPYQVLEYVQGTSLRQRLQSEQRLSARQAASLVQDAARGLTAVHDQGLIHRDVKPENLLLDEVSGRLKVADFGLARFHDDSHPRQTRTGFLVGTLQYVSPEQFRAAEQPAGRDQGLLGPASDLYSLGVVLYECLTGVPPFHGEPLSLMRQVMDEEPKRPQRLCTTVPIDLETICLKCLQKGPARRYAGAGELADDLQRFLDHQPIHARPVPRWERVLMWAQRRPGLALLGSALTVSLVVLAGVMVWLGIDAASRARANALRVAELTLEQALRSCEEGEVGRGLLELSHALTLAPPEAEPLKRVIRLNLASWTHELGAVPHRLQQTEAAILVLAVSADGSRVLTGHKGGLVHFWDGETGASLPDAGRHEQDVASACFSPDSRLALTTSGDSKARLWNAQTGALIRVLEHDGPVQLGLITSLGQVVTAGSRDAWAWPIAGQDRPQRLKHPEEVRVLNCTPDGRSLITGCNDANVRTWPLEGGAPRLLAGHRGAIRSLAVSPDGRTLATGSQDQTAQLWNLAEGKTMGPSLRHSAYISALAFSPDGSVVVTGSDDNTARLWEVKTGLPLGVPVQHYGVVLSASFSKDGSRLLTGSWDGTARLWDGYTGSPASQPLQHRTVVRGAFHLGREMLVTGDEKGMVRWWRVPPRDDRGPLLLGHKDFVGVTCSPDPDSGLALTSSPDGTVRMWEVLTGRPRGEPLDHGSPVRLAVFSAKGGSFLTVAKDGKARLWDVSQSRPRLEVAAGASVGAAAFHPDGRSFFTGTDQGLIQRWDGMTGQPLGEPLQFGSAVWRINVCSAGRHLLVSGERPEALLWDLDKPRSDPALHIRHVGEARFSTISNDGRWALTASWDGVAQVWNVKGGAARWDLTHQDRIWHAAFSPDSTRVVTCSMDRTARMWDLSTGQPIAAPLWHRGGAWIAQFSPNGRTIATGCTDSTARMWDVATGLPITPPLRYGGAVTSLDFHPSGRWVLAGSEDHTARLWKVPEPMAGGSKEIQSQVEQLTGLTLGSAGEVLLLDAPRWPLVP